MNAVLAAVVLALALVVAGCGSGEAPQASKPSPTASPTAVATATAEPEVRIRITSPRAGETVPPTTVIAGRGTPGTTIRLEGGCEAAGCRASVRADDYGLWAAELRVGGLIEASTASPEARDTVRVEVSRPTPRPTAEAPGPEAEPETIAPPSAAPERKRVVVVGDSLAVGIEGLLPALLPGSAVSIDALTSRPLADGMRIINSTDLSSEPTVLAVSLFTNDDPTQVDQLEAAVRASVTAVAPNGCAVWATIVRPPLNGVSYDAANNRLLALDFELEELVVVDWAQQVAASPDLLAGDGVHGTAAGYQARAALYARAIGACGG